MLRQAHAPRPGLPPLPFGSHGAESFDDAATVSRTQSEKTLTRIDYWPRVDGSDAFRLAYAAVHTPTVNLVATSSTAMRFSCQDATTGILLIPFGGRSSARQGREVIHWGDQGKAIYLPPGSTSGESEARQVLGIDVHPDRIQGMARTMIGQDAQHEPVDLEKFRSLDLDWGRLQFGQWFRQQMSAVDCIGADVAGLERSGLPDMILRTSIMMMAPQLFFPEDGGGGRGSDVRVARVCEYVEANLRCKLTLTDLERFGGCSARSLQYAFRRTTGRSPMQWVADRRMERVRSDLLAAGPGSTIASIASNYFTNLGDFAAAYRARYGEPPSKTLRAASRSRLRT